MSNISIFSEIGKLQTVVVHKPGKEVDYMTPGLMHELLFDDILFGTEARQEHEVFVAVMKKVAERVVDVQDLLAESLSIDQAKVHYLDRLTRLYSLSPDERAQLDELSPRQLSSVSTEGWYKELNHGADYSFRFPPVPNLLFMRDPAAVIGEGVSINNMATSARKREPYLLDTILRFHPDFHIESENNFWFNTISRQSDRLWSQYTVEGGDILVLSEDILAIGISIRTSQSAVTMMAERLRRSRQFKTLFAVLMPQERAVMHLDTIFTQIDEEHCLIYPPLLRPDQNDSLPAIQMDLTGKEVKVALKDNFLRALADCGLKLKPIFCGGKRHLDQEREQWTDGANAFCLAPGVILGYNRNVKTARELEKVGYRVLEANDVLANDRNLLDGKRTLVLIKGNELSRARGGPRCMTMPLKRER